MSDFQMIQAGRHRATCFEFEWPEAAPGKAQGIALGFRLSEGDVDQGRTITAWKYFTDGALKYTLDALRACGWRGDNPAEITIEDLGAEVELVIQHEPYGGSNEKYLGTMQAKVAFINPLGGGMVKAEKRLEVLDAGDWECSPCSPVTAFRLAGHFRYRTGSACR